jgi:cytidylate kinase
LKNIAVAIDGPAGAGKSSVSKAVAKKLGFVYVDTGAMYRASALYAIKNGIQINEKDLTPVLDDINIDIEYKDDRQIILLNGEDVSERIRESDVSMGASAIAVIPEVRLKLVELQRELADKRSVIMDGRDIGTYVLPRAELKIYLTASIDERARRRYAELVQKGSECNFDEVREDIKKRDFNDMNREFAPLKTAEDAVLVDSSDMTFDEVIETILKLIEEKTGHKAGVTECFTE